MFFMKRINILFVLLVFTGVSSYAQRQQKKIAGNYTATSECLGVELDGSQTIKAWGKGTRKADAIEQAKKNAVRDVIFYGIQSGQSGCKKKPLINEVNAQDKYEDYFNIFFTDGGAFVAFISMKDEPLKLRSNDKKKAVDGVQYGVIVRVLRAELKKKLIFDGIIKP